MVCWQGKPFGGGAGIAGGPSRIEICGPVGAELPSPRVTAGTTHLQTPQV